MPLQNLPALHTWCSRHVRFLTPKCFRHLSFTEAVAQRCSVKNVFSGISQNSQENTCARVSFLIKLQAEVKLENMSYYYIPFTSTFN